MIAAGPSAAGGFPVWPQPEPCRAAAVIKARPEDFRVDELPAFAPAEEGEHLYLRLEKTGLGTPEIARWLAGVFEVPEVAVGYAGMKDKHAVTTQWFSVHTPDGACRVPARHGVRLVGDGRHRRKLRRGELGGNRFAIRLSRVTGTGWEERLEQICRDGAPNYFGPQRFGADNLEAARRWLGQRRRRRMGRFREGLYRSVLRSFLFNEVLAARVRDGSWNRVLEGEVVIANEPSGPLWGRGRSPAAAEALAVEQAALAPHAALCEGLEHAGLTQQRRSLVLRAPDLEWHCLDTDLEVRFTLAAGGYATSLLGAALELHRDGERP